MRSSSRSRSAPLTITETGYRSHVLDRNYLAEAGDPARFFLDWIERDAKSKTWHQTDFHSRQGDLFAVTPRK